MNITSVFMIAACVFFLCIQNILKKQFSMKCKGGSLTFSAMITFFALLFFVAASGGFVYDQEFLPYSLGFAFTYSAAAITSYLAITCGSLAITSLVIAYSLVIPTLYGLLVLKEEAGILQYVGILLLLVSLYLVRGSEDEKTTVKFTPRWLIYVGIAFITNGMCSVIQNAQQRAFGGKYNSSFMIVALSIGVLAMLLMALIFERKEMKEAVKHGFLLAGLCGISNGAVNLLVMLVIAVVASSVFFPVLSAAQLVITFLISVVLYKEKFIPRQIAGLVLGILSLVFLNL